MIRLPDPLSEEDKFSKFIKYLALGYKFKIAGAIYCMTNTHKLGMIVATEEEPDINKSNAAIPLDADMEVLWNLAQCVSDTEFFLIGAQQVLQTGTL